MPLIFICCFGWWWRIAKRLSSSTSKKDPCHWVAFETRWHGSEEPAATTRILENNLQRELNFTLVPVRAHRVDLTSRGASSRQSDRGARAIKHTHGAVVCESNARCRRSEVRLVEQIEHFGPEL